MRLLTTLLLLLASAGAWAQQFYTLSVSQKPYTPLKNPVVLVQSPFPYIQQNYTVEPGFAINFFGQPRYSFTIAPDGQISFSSVEFIYTLTSYLQLTDIGSTVIQYEVDTTDCNNRVVKVEIVKAGFYCDTTNTESTTHQIWLYQNGTVAVHYGTTTINNPQWAKCTDINSRMQSIMLKSTFIDNYFYQVGGTAAAPLLNCHNCPKNNVLWFTAAPPAGTLYTFESTQPRPPYVAANNPLENELRIQYQGYCARNPPQNHKAVVYTVDGKKVYEVEVNNTVTRLNTTNLQRGVYILHVYNEADDLLYKQKLLRY